MTFPQPAVPVPEKPSWLVIHSHIIEGQWRARRGVALDIKPQLVKADSATDAADQVTRKLLRDGVIGREDSDYSWQVFPTVEGLPVETLVRTTTAVQVNGK